MYGMSSLNRSRTMSGNKASTEEQEEGATTHCSPSRSSSKTGNTVIKAESNDVTGMVHNSEPTLSRARTMSDLILNEEEQASQDSRRAAEQCTTADVSDESTARALKQSIVTADVVIEVLTPVSHPLEAAATKNDKKDASVPSLISVKVFKKSRHAKLGIRFKTSSANGGTLVVDHVSPNGRLALSPIRVGDRLVSLDNRNCGNCWTPTMAVQRVSDMVRVFEKRCGESVATIANSSVATMQRCCSRLRRPPICGIGVSS
jgi:hypothetical protein